MRVAVLAAALLAVIGPIPAAVAQPRAPLPPWEDPSGPPVAMDVWLKRLVGRFRFEGLVQVYSQGPCETGACQAVTGVGDCEAIGEGPGVQCIFDVRWQDMYNIDFEAGSVRAVPGSISYLNPSMALFGMEPGVPSIRYLLVDNKGLPEGGPGANNGYRARFITRCVNEPVGCQRMITFEAREDANLLYMTVEIDNEITRERISSIVMSLRRVVPEQPPAATAPRPSRVQPPPPPPPPGRRRR